MQVIPLNSMFLCKDRSHNGYSKLRCNPLHIANVLSYNTKSVQEIQDKRLSFHWCKSFQAKPEIPMKSPTMLL